MAQLSGVMTADFSDFNFEIDKSVVKLKELEGASVRTDHSIDGFSEGLGAADKTLNLFGVRIGPQIQALRELGGAAGKTASEIGLVGTAALTAAAAVGGWTLGRMIADFAGLDEKIGNATASLLGFGDVAAERTAAKMDVLNRAAQITGRTVLNFDEAMQIIKTHNLQVAESFNTGAERVRQWEGELAKVAKDMPQIQAELKNHTSTVAEIAQHYGISTRALEYYNRTLADSTKVQKAWADEARPKYEAIAKAQAELTAAAGGWHATLTAMAPTTVAATMAALNYGNSQTTVATALNLTAAQVDAVDRQMKLNLATMAATEPALGTLDQWVKTNAGDLKVWNTEWRFTSEVIDNEVIPSLQAVTAQAQATSAAVSAAVAPGMTQLSPGNAPVPINTGNITYGLGGFENVFAEYMRKHPSGGALGGAIGGGPPADFLTWALSMGLAQRGPTINNQFNIVDTESGIANRIGNTITGQIQQGSMLN